MAEGGVHGPARPLPNRSRHTTRGDLYASYNVAKKLLEFEFKEEIPRTRLRAGYGQGFLGAPVRCSPSAEGAFPQEQQHDDGTERSQDPQVCRGADHV